jgi:hypothetical protein
MPPAGPIKDDLPMKCSQIFFNLFIDPFYGHFFILCIFVGQKNATVITCSLSFIE